MDSGASARALHLEPGGAVFRDGVTLAHVGQKHGREGADHCGVALEPGARVVLENAVGPLAAKRRIPQAARNAPVRNLEFILGAFQEALESPLMIGELDIGAELLHVLLRLRGSWCGGRRPKHLHSLDAQGNGRARLSGCPGLLRCARSAGRAIAASFRVQPVATYLPARKCSSAAAWRKPVPRPSGPYWIPGSASDTAGADALWCHCGGAEGCSPGRSGWLCSYECQCLATGARD